MTFHTKIVTKFEHLEGIREDWLRLWKADSDREVFMNFNWVQAVWSAYGEGVELATPIVYRGSEVVGILPLAHHGDRLRFLGSPHSDYNDLLSLPEPATNILGAAIEALLRDAKRFNVAILENVPDGSRLARGLQGLEPGLRSKCSISVSSSCPSTRFEESGDSLLETIVNTKRLRQYERRLARFGDVRFCHLEDMNSIHRHLPEFFRQHIARRAFAGGRSLFLDISSRRFYESLVEKLDPESFLRFSVLEAGDIPVAYHFGFESNGKFILYKPVFNVDYWGFSPGDVLLKRLFEYAVNRGLNELDFTAGDEAYKHRYANHTRNVYTILVFNRGLGGDVVRVRTNARRFLNRYPRVISFLRGGRSRVAKGAAYVSKAVHTHGWPGSLVEVGRKMARSILCVDEVMVFRVSGDPPLPGKVQLKLGSLSDLGIIAAYDPDFDQNKLHQARARLRDGDQLYLAYTGDRVTHVAWLGSRKSVDPTPDAGNTIVLPDEGGYIYDCWVTSELRGKGAYTEVLKALLGKALALASECWIHCRYHDRDMCKDIETVGFSPRYLVRSIRIFGRVIRKSSQSLAGG